MQNLSEIEIANGALSLPEPTRLRLASKLLSSVQSGALPSLSEQEAEALAASRAQEIDSGKVETLDFNTEMERIKNSLKT